MDESELLLQEYIEAPSAALEDSLSFGIWQLWNQRNSFLFSSGTVTRNIQDLCIKKSVEFFAIVSDKPNKNLRTNIQVKWTKPPVGWLKLNTD